MVVLAPPISPYTLYLPFDSRFSFHLPAEEVIGGRSGSVMDSVPYVLFGIGLLIILLGGASLAVILPYLAMTNRKQQEEKEEKAIKKSKVKPSMQTLMSTDSMQSF